MKRGEEAVAEGPPRVVRIGAAVALALAAWLAVVAIDVFRSAAQAASSGGRQAILVIGLFVAVSSLVELRLAWIAFHGARPAGLFVAAIVAFVAGVFLLFVTSGYRATGPLTIMGALVAACTGLLWRRSVRAHRIERPSSKPDGA